MIKQERKTEKKNYKQFDFVHETFGFYDAARLNI